MLFRYWIEFDEEGDICGLYRDKPSFPCKEYLLKLIPVERSAVKDIEKASKELTSNVTKATTHSKRLQSELNKVIKELRRIKL